MPSTEEAITWIEAAEQCQQTELRLACVSRLVQQLVGKEPAGRELAAGIADAALLEGCDKGTLLLLLGLVTGAVRQLAPRTQLLDYKAPSSGAIATALQHAASSGSYEWRIEHFSQQPAQVGSKLSSPWFMAGGREWQLTLYPYGSFQENAGHLSSECLHTAQHLSFYGSNLGLLWPVDECSPVWFDAQFACPPPTPTPTHVCSVHTSKAGQ